MYKPNLLYIMHVKKSFVSYYYNQGLNKKGNPANIYTCKEASQNILYMDI